MSTEDLLVDSPLLGSNDECSGKKESGEDLLAGRPLIESGDQFSETKESTEDLVVDKNQVDNGDAPSEQKSPYVVGRKVSLSGVLLECMDEGGGLWSMQLQDGTVLQVRETNLELVESAEGNNEKAIEVPSRIHRISFLRTSVSVVAEQAFGFFGAGARGAVHVTGYAGGKLGAGERGAVHVTGYAGEKLSVVAGKASNTGGWLGSKIRGFRFSSYASSQVPVEPECRRMAAFSFSSNSSSLGESSETEEQRGLLKTINETGDSEVVMNEISTQMDDMSQPGLGIVCRKGLHREATNQDAWFIVKLRKDFVMYCVMDGHGLHGHTIANFVKTNLPKLILQDERLANEDSELPLVCTDAFERMQRLIESESEKENLDALLSGSTATLVIHDLKKEIGNLTVACIGNSVATLVTRNNDTMTPCETIARGQAPDIPAERLRVESNGGRVVFDDYSKHRLFAKGKQYPGLTVSRSFGDILGHREAGMIATPEVEVFTTKPNQYVLLCSNGVWEFVCETEAARLVSMFSLENATLATQRLAKEAWDRWIREEGGLIVDDITVILSHLDQTKYPVDKDSYQVVASQVDASGS